MHVDVEHLAPALRVGLAHGPEVHGPGRGDDAVEAAELHGQAVHGMGQRRGVGDVRDPDDRGAPELVRQPGEALGPPCHQPDPRTGGDGGPRRGLPDARGRARHHDPPAVQGSHAITVARAHGVGAGRARGYARRLW